MFLVEIGKKYFLYSFSGQMASTSYDPPPWAGKSGIGLHLDVLKVT